MSTTFPHCSLESKARAGRSYVPAVPGAAPQTLCHYGQSAPAELGPGCPQGARVKSPADQWQDVARNDSFKAPGALRVLLRSVRRGAAKTLAPLEPGIRIFLERSPPPPDARNRASPPPSSNGTAMPP
jgi:hypothetical protein